MPCLSSRSRTAAGAAVCTVGRPHTERAGFPSRLWLRSPFSVLCSPWRWCPAKGTPPCSAPREEQGREKGGGRGHGVPPSAPQSEGPCLLLRTGFLQPQPPPGTRLGPPSGSRGPQEFQARQRLPFVSEESRAAGVSGPVGDDNGRMGAGASLLGKLKAMRRCAHWRSRTLQTKARKPGPTRAPSPRPRPPQAPHCSQRHPGRLTQNLWLL